MSNEVQPTSPVTHCVTRIESVEEYLNAVDNEFQRICPATGKCELWYRGQNELNQPLNPVRWDLVPDIARKPRNPLMEIIYLSEFKSYAIPFGL